MIHTSQTATGDCPVTSVTAGLGLLLPSREVTLWADGDVGRLVEAASAAEAAGFDSVWVGESLLARPRPEPLTTLAAIAARTSAVRLGTAVLLPLLRHPLLLAHGLATVDRLAGGRLIAGIAPGAQVEGTLSELAAVGMPADRRVARLRDGVAALRRLWTDAEPGVLLRPRPLGPAGPPLWLAAQGPRMLRLAGRDFDGWLPFTPTQAGYRQGLQVVRSAAEAAGRDPARIEAAAYLTLAVDDSARAAWNALDRYMLAYYGQPAEVMAGIQACHAGTIETAAEWVSGYIDAGATSVIIRIAAPGITGYSPAAGALLGRLAGSGRILPGSHAR
jgi:alkanesulfonate monooxygenase SsuD/methylene tetrahydromethanopterin reductase-like flavin-dependent oxidoreductase (luciferase family)